jgi:hypothetical protein
MCTQKNLDEIYEKFESGEIRPNILSRELSENKEIKIELEERSKELNSHYEIPKPLQRLWFVFKDQKIHKCSCGNPKNWRNFKKGYNKTCSDRKCVGLQNLESTKKFYQEKFGVDHLFQTEKFKTDLKGKFMEIYGVDNPGKSETIKDKIKKTNLEKYGEDNWLKVKGNSEKIRSKIADNHRRVREEKIEKFSIPILIEEIIDKRSAKFKCLECGNENQVSPSFFNKNISIGKNPCLVCNPPLYSESKGEIELCEFIESIYTGKVEKKNRKILQGKEIDIYLEEEKIAFEFNGIYYHSEIFQDKSSVMFKKERLSQLGITLVTVWEDDWNYKKDIIKSRINSILGGSEKIPARKCKVREISGKEERKFLEENHIQGYVPSSIKIGLFQGEDLVSLMTFGKYRKALGAKEKSNEYELLRFCNLRGISVIGGASKIFSFFTRKYSPERVISYQNNSWNTGNLYENLGFSSLGLTGQNYFWCKGNLRHGRFQFRKDKLIKDGFDPDKTEDQIMTERGFYKIWDMGNIKWEHKKA